MFGVGSFHTLSNSTANLCAELLMLASFSVMRTYYLVFKNGPAYKEARILTKTHENSPLDSANLMPNVEKISL